MSATRTPTIYNLTLTDADTEYSQVIPLSSRITFQCRTAFDVRFAFETGKVATPTAPYGTVKSGSSFDETFEESNEFNGTLFLASSQAAVVVEIVVWDA